MKLATRHNNVVSNGGIGEDSGFSIAMNAKMFRTLSDTMYEDKIGSMIRELSCNAVDAHIAAGEPSKPIFIHLPDQIEPWFAVRDEGVGLSDADIRAMYTTYGASTKDQSNDMIGAFGLGSKTPFAYIDQFTVTSVFDGVKRIYIAVMNDEGLPILKLQHEENTSEHAGLEVMVSVNSGDFVEFRNKVIEQLRFFEVKPTLLNNRFGIEFTDFDDEEYLIKKDGVQVFSDRINSGVSGIWVVQGGVGYSLSINNLGDMKNAVREFANAISHAGAIINFDLGDIEVTASREGISYTAETCKRIIDKMETVANKVSTETINEFRKIDSLWERVEKYNALMSIMKKAVRNASDFKTLFPEDRVEGERKMLISVRPIHEMGLNVSRYERHTGFRRGNWTDTFVRLRRKEVKAIFPDEATNVFIRDTNKKPIARLKLFAEQNDYEPILVVEGFDKDNVDVKKVSKALGIPESKINFLSHLPAPKNASGTSDTARPKAFMMPTSGSISSSQEWDKVFDSIDDIGPAIWVEMDRHNISWRNGARLVLEAAKRGLVSQPVIAVNGQTADRITNGKIGAKLTPATEYAKTISDKIESLKSTYMSINKYRGFMHSFNNGNRHVQKSIKNSNVSKIGSVAKRLEQLKKRVEGWTWGESFMSESDIEASKRAFNDGSIAGKAKNEEIETRYPLLAHLNTYENIPSEHIEEYIKLMDERG